MDFLSKEEGKTGYWVARCWGLLFKQLYQFHGLSLYLEQMATSGPSGTLVIFLQFC